MFELRVDQLSYLLSQTGFVIIVKYLKIYSSQDNMQNCSWSHLIFSTDLNAKGVKICGFEEAITTMDLAIEHYNRVTCAINSRVAHLEIIWNEHQSVNKEFLIEFHMYNNGARDVINFMPVCRIASNVIDMKGK